ncbi:hypothetical protein BH24ACT15_BH24ACT15_37160 [soil metagenome]
MNTLMIGKRSTVVSTVMVVVGMALLGAMLVGTVDAAPEDTGEAIDNGAGAAEQECKLFGGQGSTHYEFNVDGGVDKAITTCVGGGLDGRVCTTTPTAWSCGTPGKFVQPTQQVVPEQRPDTAAPVENPQQTFPIVGDVAAPPGGVAEDPTGDEQARIVDPATACEALGGTVTAIGQGATVPVDIRCTGGTLDDMICYGTICDYFTASAGPEGTTQAPPTGGIEFVQVEDLENAADISEMPETAEDPTGGETVVIANQSGPAIHDAAMFQLALCRIAGGVERVYEERTVGSGLISIGITCTGGLLDGMACRNSATMSQCLVRSVVPEDPRVTPVVAEDPTGSDNMVIVYQSDLSVDEKTKGQKAFCEGIGGKVTPMDSGPEVSVVECKGGLLDGMTCFNSEKATNCMFVSVVLPENPQVTPAAGVEAPVGDAPTATVVATEAAPSPTATATATPPMPTMTPTDVPAEPTVAPPSDPPPPPRNDDSVPPGESIEPVEPTPTPVVLT